MTKSEKMWLEAKELETILKHKDKDPLVVRRFVKRFIIGTCRLEKIMVMGYLATEGLEHLSTEGGLKWLKDTYSS